MMPNLTKADEALAHYLSEWLNDSAPLGWRRYLAVAQDMLRKNIVQQDWLEKTGRTPKEPTNG